MRLLWPLLTATGISLSVAARSTTASGGLPYNAAPYSPAGVSPRKMNASVALELVKAHGNEEGIDRDRRSDEERGDPPLTPLIELLGKAEPLLKATEITPLAILERLEVKAGKDFEDVHDSVFLGWAQAIDVYRAEHPEYTVEVEVKDLLTITNARTLAKIFHRFRKVDGMQSHADELLRALVAKSEEVARRMIPVWLKDGVNPDKVFDMLPVALKKPSADSVEEEAVKEWIQEWFLTWIKYIDQHVELGHSYDDAATVTKLVVEWGEKESVNFLLSLQNTGIKNRIDRLTSTLGEKYPDTLRLMFDLWLTSNTGPVDVFDMMPIGTKGYLKGKLHRRDLWEEIERDLSQWHKYDMEHSAKALQTFSDTDGRSLLELFKTTVYLRDVLLNSNKPSDMVEFAEYLRTYKDWNYLVFELERKMLSGPVSEYESLLFDKWAEMKLSPHAVFNSMPISTVRSYNPQKPLKEGVLERNCDYLKQLLKYVDDQRVTFIDDKDKSADKDKTVIKILLNNWKGATELRAFLVEFGKRGMEERSRRLVKALDARVKTLPYL